jgi:hypothetical protein
VSTPPPWPSGNAPRPEFSILLPYRRTSYQSDLSAKQIGQRLSEHVIASLEFFSRKEYYGGFTSYSFSVRKVHSRLKKQSLGPSIQGSYEDMDGKMIVALRITPHPVLICILVVLGAPMLLFFMLSIGELFTTGNPGDMLASLVPVIVLYGLFWALFQFQCGNALRFWEHTLRLREIRPQV